ncbi:Mor transcription activator family protein [Pseudomonas sp.]|uniref:Mor transcription activator family protein n=1 Tax=Pseudomonas sp. TaxID=306 RepID=UPI003D0ED672
MEIDIDQLPQSAAEIVDVVGVEATLRLVEAWGGVRLYVPQQMPEDHLLVSTLGRGEADQLAERYGGDTIQIPRCLHALRAVRNCRIRAERHDGASPALLALRYGLTERQVYAIIAAADEPVDDRQQSLL